MTKLLQHPIRPAVARVLKAASDHGIASHECTAAVQHTVDIAVELVALQKLLGEQNAEQLERRIGNQCRIIENQAARIQELEASLRLIDPATRFIPFTVVVSPDAGMICRKQVPSSTAFSSCQRPKDHAGDCSPFQLFEVKP